MSTRPSRREVLRLATGAVALAAWPATAEERPASARWRWAGTVLGARGSITIDHASKDHARRLVHACRAEIRRLERVFSLHRPDSALARLNRDGALDTPPPELLEVLSLARALAVRTDGAFDVTVQPLWALYRRHFSRAGAARSGPPPRDLERALDLVEGEAVSFDAGRVRLGRRGMALTLNGIAQGYIADRVSRLLERAECSRALLDVGEIRALGAGWRIGLPGGDASLRTAGPTAIATSSPAGFRFEESGVHHHLFNPSTGRSASRHAAVTVLAPSAALADGLSTACALLDGSQIAALAGALDGVSIRLLEADGSVRWLG